MGNGGGIEEPGAQLIGLGKCPVVEVIGGQLLPDIADGVELPGAEAEAQLLQHTYREFCAGVGIPDGDFAVEGGRQSGQMVVQIPVGPGIHFCQPLLQQRILLLRHRQAVQCDACGAALVVVAAGLLGNKAAVEGCMVIPPGKGAQVA